MATNATLLLLRNRVYAPFPWIWVGSGTVGPSRGAAQVALCVSVSRPWETGTVHSQMGVQETSYRLFFWMTSYYQFSRSVVFDSLQPHGLQHARPPCPSPTPGVYPNSCPLSRWCHPAISSSAVPFSSHFQSFKSYVYYYLKSSKESEIRLYSYLLALTIISAT